MKALPIIIAALLLAGCPLAPLPAGSLADPSALAVAFSATAPNNSLVFVAEGDGQDLRAFEQFASPNPLFVRGPNAISALSIPMNSTLNGTVLPSFRAQRMAGGEFIDSNRRLGFLAVAGTANRLAVIDTQTSVTAFGTTVSADDAAKCAAGMESISCLSGPALDVATSSDSATTAFALLAPDATGAQKIVVLDATTVGACAPTSTTDCQAALMLDGTTPFITLPAGPFGRLTAAVTGANETTLYLASVAPGSSIQGVISIVVVSSTDPVTQLTTNTVMPPTSIFMTEGPVRVAYLTPSYKDASGSSSNPAFVLAVLADGRIQTLDPSNCSPICTPAVDASSAPLVPTSFQGVPALDLSFMLGQTLRLGSNTTVPTGLAVFVGLGDGTAAVMTPDPAVPFNASAPQPQIFRPTLTGPATITATIPLYEPLPALGPAPASMSTPTGYTVGITRSEVITATYAGVLPGFLTRTAKFAAGPMGTYTLTDSQGLAPTVQLSPLLTPPTPTSICVNGSANLNCAYPLTGDRVVINSIDPSCMAIGSVSFTITEPPSTAAPSTLTLTPQFSAPSCVPSVVTYDVVAAFDPTPYEPFSTGPWIVAGTTSGYLGRASSGSVAGTAGPVFTYLGTQFFYPTNTGGGQAFSFTITPAAGLTPSDGDTISFDISNDFTPFILSSTASPSGLTVSLATVGEFLFMAIEGADSLTEIDVPNFTLTNSTNDYR